jgi:tungstate transport system permease protein
MGEIESALDQALAMIARADPALGEIVGLSLQVSLTATTIAGLLGLPLGALIALGRFPGRGLVQVVVNALMGLPSVVLGLLVYLALSRAGPLGTLGLLYTPTAMILAQSLLIAPIVAALSAAQIESLAAEYDELLRSLGAGRGRAALTLLWEGRFALATALLAAFGRAIGEIASVMIVGGNIDHVTRTMTTAIALETARGNLALALALGFVLVGIVVLVNAAVFALRRVAERLAPA